MVPLGSTSHRILRGGVTRAAVELPYVRKPEVVFDRDAARVLAVTPSGRVLIVEDVAPGRDRALVVLQWLRELRQRLPLPITAPR